MLSTLYYTVLVAQSFSEDLLTTYLAWMQQLSIRGETSVKRSIDGTSIYWDKITPVKLLDFPRAVESKRH